MNQELEFFPPDIAQLLARGAALVEPPEYVRARLRQRLATTVAAGPVAFTSAGHSQGLAATIGSSRTFIGFAGGVAGFLAGVAAMVALNSTSGAVPLVPATTFVRPSAVTTIAEAPPPELPQAAPSRAQEAIPAHPLVSHRRAPARAAIEVAVAEKAPVSPSIQSAPVPATHLGLEAEGELLQKGRTAMVRGDSEGALAAVEEHASRFPQGKLAEEREALRIQVLVSEDRNPEARSALGAFHLTYPKSLLGPALEEAVVGKIQ